MPEPRATVTGSEPEPVRLLRSAAEATILDAFASEQAKSPTATQLWARADREITDQAPFVSFVTPSINDFVSRRVGNYQYNPEFGVLIDQL